MPAFDNEIDLLDRPDDEDSCRWVEPDVETDFDPDEGGQPAALCHHPEGKGFCDYCETGDMAICPLFQYNVPRHEVEIRQYLEMIDQD